MKKIVFVMGSLRRGGAERVISILANHYAEKGWQTDVLLLLDMTCGYELHPSVSVHDFTCKGSSVKAIPFWVKKIRSFVKSTSPDTVVSFIGRINTITAFACAGTGVRFVCSERNDPRSDGRSALELKLCRFAYRFADAVIFQNKYQHEVFGNIKIGQVIVNPVSDKLPEATFEKKNIVSMGRLMPQKNFPFLIRVFAKFLQVHPEYELHIYGEGALRGELEELSQSLGINDKVFLPGNFPDVHQMIKDAEIFVQCSDFEGMSNALIEAMTMGLVCISSDWAGVREIIEDNKTGLIFPINDEDALLSKLTLVAENSETAKKLKSNALKFAEKFRQDTVLTEWEKVIEGSEK